MFILFLWHILKYSVTTHLLAPEVGFISVVTQSKDDYFIPNLCDCRFLK